MNPTPKSKCCGYEIIDCLSPKHKGLHRCLRCGKHVSLEGSRTSTSILPEEHLKHIVGKTDICYVCKRCGKAAGDGDGFIGERCQPTTPANGGRFICPLRKIGEHDCLTCPHEGREGDNLNSGREWCFHCKKILHPTTPASEEEKCCENGCIIFKDPCSHEHHKSPAPRPKEGWLLRFEDERKKHIEDGSIYASSYWVCEFIAAELAKKDAEIETLKQQLNEK